MSDFDVFHFDPNKQSFENYAHSNGMRFWWGRDLMDHLGYQDFSAFEKAVNRAIRACTTLGVAIFDNFHQDQREIDGRLVRDYKLSRFACYLTAMNGDIRKPQVAKAQAYFAAVAETARQYFQNAESVVRVVIRDEVSEHEKSLSGTAFSAGVENYGLFRNAGYRGMYNMDLSRLRKVKGIEGDRTLLDFMGKQELAGNLFRITETEARIKNHNIQGQRALENTAEHVGQTVRKTMIDLSGTRPESLPIANDIKEVRRGLKKTEKEFAKLDAPRKP